MNHPASPRRGDVWLADLGDPIGHEQGFRRPIVVVSADNMNQGSSGRVIAVPLTRTRRRLPSHVEIEPGASGPTETSYATVEDLRSISVDRLIGHRGTLSSDALHRISRVAALLLDLKY
ncbi:MAG: type II toxin-antitoxin system PemK/MazF family toxin [Mycobacteriales bacterium]